MGWDRSLPCSDARRRVLQPPKKACRILLHRTLCWRSATAQEKPMDMFNNALIQIWWNTILWTNLFVVSRPFSYDSNTSAPCRSTYLMLNNMIDNTNSDNTTTTDNNVNNNTITNIIILVSIKIMEIGHGSGEVAELRPEWPGLQPRARDVTYNMVIWLYYFYLLWFQKNPWLFEEVLAKGVTFNVCFEIQAFLLWNSSLWNKTPNLHIRYWRVAKHDVRQATDRWLPVYAQSPY